MRDGTKARVSGERRVGGGEAKILWQAKREKRKDPGCLSLLSKKRKMIDHTGIFAVPKRLQQRLQRPKSTLSRFCENPGLGYLF
jgi:hypothetical protein